MSFDEATGKPVICRQCVCCPDWTGTVTGYGLGGYAGSDGNASNGTCGLGGTLVTIERQLDQNHVFGLFWQLFQHVVSLGRVANRSRQRRTVRHIFSSRRRLQLLAGGRLDRF